MVRGAAKRVIERSVDKTVEGAVEYATKCRKLGAKAFIFSFPLTLSVYSNGGWLNASFATWAQSLTVNTAIRLPELGFA